MKETLSAYKEQIRKQTLQKDKLCLITKLPDGKIIDVNVVEWVGEPIIEDLVKQADINKQEYLAEQGKLKDLEKQQLEDMFDVVKAEIALLNHNLEYMGNQVEELQKELALIRGDE